MRRGRGRRTRNICIYYNNINGISSKRDSLKKIIDDVQPDIICLCETKVGSIVTIEKLLSKYKVIGRCTKYGQGGVIIAAKKDVYSLFLDVSSSDNKNIIAGRIKIGNHILRIVLGYAPQETEDEEACEDFYTDVAVEVQKGVINGEYPVLVGDMNAKIEKGNGLFEYQPQSRNGEIMIETLTDTCNLEVMNFNEKCSGKWTHVIRTTGESSVLDYIMVADSTKIKEMTKDEAGIMCPFHTISDKGQKRNVLSDHNAIIVDLHMPYEKRSYKKAETEGKSGWVVNEEGLEALEEAVSKEMEKRNSPPRMETSETSAQDNYDSFETLLDSVMDHCFERSNTRKKGTQADKVSSKYVEISKRINKLSRRGKVQREVARKYRDKIMKLNEEVVAEIKTEIMAKIIEQMTREGKFSAEGFWKLRKAMRMKTQMCTSVITEEGTEVFGEEGIKETYQKEFENRLRPREIEKGFERIREKTEELCQLVLEKCAQEKEDPFSMKELNNVEKRLRKGKATGVDKYPAELFIKGGDALDKELLVTLNDIKTNISPPKQWNEVGV